MRARFVLLHYHIFKNAGSTIDSILRRNFGDKFVALEPTGEREVVSNQELVDFVQDHPNILAIASHNMRLPSPSPNIANVKFVQICLVRHPLDRLQSIYYHYRRAKTSERESLKAKELSMPDFLRWLVETQPFNCVNSQTCFFSRGGDYYFTPSPTHLQEAALTVREISFLGIVERFDESLITAEYFLKSIYEGLDLRYTPENVRPSRDLSLTERLADMKGRCDRTLYEELQRLNELDLQLWNVANEELDRRLSFVPDREGRLESFKSRCKSFSESLE